MAPTAHPDQIACGEAFVKRNAYEFGFSQGRRGIPRKEEADDVPWWCRREYREGHRDGSAARLRFQAEAVA